METKVCNTCGEEKPSTHFYIRSKKTGSLRSDCKICYSNKSSEKNRKPSSIKARKESWRKYQRYKLYGITKEDYKNMFWEQNGMCKICGHPDNDDNLHIDHDHKTGKVRGLLCNLCNNGLGFFKDDPKLLRAAIDYLSV